MPIVGFEKRDILRGTIVTPGWYKVRIEEFGEEPSKDRNSTNYPVDGTIICSAEDGSTQFAEVPVKWNFNSKAMGFSIGYLKALGVEVEAGKRYDLAQTVGKEIEMYIGNKEYEGRIINDLKHQYRPLRENA